MAKGYWADLGLRVVDSVASTTVNHIYGYPILQPKHPAGHFDAVMGSRIQL